MSHKLPYAQLATLEQAVKACRVVEFTFKGKIHQAEPHRVFGAPRTGAIVARCWINDIGWRDVRYCDMRCLELREETFDGREMPLGRMERLV